MRAHSTRRFALRPTGLALLASLSLGMALPAQALQRPVNHDDYDSWKSLRSTTYSADGQWIAYTVSPKWGDGVLEVKQVDGDTTHRHELGSSPKFTADSRFLVFTIGKSTVEARNKKLKELAEKGKVTEEKEETGSEEERRQEMMQRFTRRGPGSRPRGRGGRGGRGSRGGGRGDMAILELATGKVEKIERVKGFRVPDEAAYLVYHLDAPKKTEDDNEKEAGDANKEAAEEKSAEAKPGAEKTAAKTKTKTKESTEETTGEGSGERGARGRPSMLGESRGGRRGRGEAGGRRGRGEAGGWRGRGERGERGGRGERGARTEGSGSDKSSDPEERKRRDGTPLVVRDLTTGKERRYENVVSYGMVVDNKWIHYHSSKKEKTEGVDYGLYAVKLAGGDKATILAGEASFSGMTVDEDGTAMAFFSDKEDLAAKKPKSDLYLWSFSPKPAVRIVHAGTPGMPADKNMSRSVSFSKDGSVLTFSVQSEREDKKSKILPDEKVTLDLWHWQDGAIQPAQAKRRGGNNSSLTCVFHRDENRVVVLGDEQIPSMRLITPDGSRALATDSKPYEKQVQWDGRYTDAYIVNTITGARTKVVTELRGRVSASPTGRYLTYFDTDYHWYAIDVNTLAKRDLTGGLGIHFERESDDHPHPDPAHGTAGWTADDAEVVIYDEFDLWKISPSTGAAVCITDGLGRANNIRFRIQSMDRDEDHLPDDLTLKATNVQTMGEGIYRDSLATTRKPTKVVWFEKSLGGITKAKEADRLFFTVQTYRDYPDVWTSGLDYDNQKKLTDIGSRQPAVRWGDAELVTWASSDGKQLKGILIKPDGFDPTKKWPMMVHFYEKMSSRLHRYSAPSAGTSPSAAYYVSNGYLWFMPDIVYDEGYPGPSCVKCVVSGVQNLINKGFVDEKAIGAAGHSWGGYQTAFLVTRSDIFAAVESGAPVSNMVSAYGGIRYQSGVSRQFQYEQTQSRIGGSLWEYPMRYWENSPIYFADRVNTPVLILHNDQDGAVPWTNGIEYFMALRRLGKESYLFNYTGEAHGIRKKPNQLDWTRRMAEYFAHHLKGEPAAKWMTDGVPYSERDSEKLEHVKSYHEILALEAKEPATTKPATLDPTTTKPATAEASATSNNNGGQ